MFLFCLFVQKDKNKSFYLVKISLFRISARVLETHPIVIHYNDLKEDDGIIYLPIYMTPLL